jgi:hypothetical protein
MYDVAKLRVITLPKTLHPRSRTNKKLKQQNQRDNDLWKITTSNNMRSMAKYRLSVECTEDNLAIANTELRIMYNITKH